MRNFYSLLLLVMAGCLSSCNHYFYSPNSANVPMMREKGEARAAIHYFNADEIEGFETQLAFSPLRHLGITFDYASAKGGDDYNNGNGRQIGGGVGYYRPVNKDWTFETYAGYNQGQINNRFDSLSSYDVKYSKIYLQPAMGFSRDYFDFIFSCRVAYVYHNPRYDDNYYVNATYSVLSEVIATPQFWTLEPAFTFRAGWKYIKVQTQIGGSINLTNLSYPQEKSIFSIGLYSSFAPRWLAGKNGHRHPKAL